MVSNPHGFGLFALELRATGELIGFAGLAVSEFLPEVMPAVEIGWRLGRPFWGQGLATEAARVALRFGLIARGLERIVSIAQVGNGASEGIMSKLGMCLERETVDPTCNRPVRVHAITKAGYVSAGQREQPGASAGNSGPLASVSEGPLRSLAACRLPSSGRSERRICWFPKLTVQ